MALTFRVAERGDVDSIVQMLSDDPLGAEREDYREPLPGEYLQAFAAIDADANNELVVALEEGTIVGALQLTFIPYLTYRGGWRALIEGVRVARHARSRGIGRQLFEWCIERARQRNCHMVQLTVDNTRSDAHQFYRSLGFEATHLGMKLHLQRERQA